MRATYLSEAYRSTLTAAVRTAESRELELSDTVFHPSGGGQPGDVGTIEGAGGPWRVEATEERGGRLLHRLSAGPTDPPPVGTEVRMAIDWPRRYRFMRYHTALHLLSGVVFQRFGSGITGNQIAEDRARMDFSLADFARPLAEELLEATNAVAARNLPVEVRFISAAEFAQRPELVRVATAKRGPAEEARLIDIVGFDVQADGGTHVRSTEEVGRLSLDRIENKGARNKRLYLSLDSREPPAVP